MSHKVVENFLSKKNYNTLYNAMTSEYFPWYYNNYKLHNVPKQLFHYQLTHVFFKNNTVNSSYFEILKPLIKKIKANTLLKIKANLNPISQDLIQFGSHVDNVDGVGDPTSQSVIYYLNSNNGYTKIKNKKIKSKANTAVFFPSNTSHYGTNSTNCNNRMVINIIYVL